MLCGSFFGRSTSPATLAKKKKKTLKKRRLNKAHQVLN